MKQIIEEKVTIKRSILNSIDQLTPTKKADFFVDLGYQLQLDHLLHPDVRKDSRSNLGLPEQAPELYRDRKDRTEKPADFILRVYEDWLGKGFARSHLMNLDRPLYDALHNWLRKNPMPEALILPTKKEMIDAELSEAGIGDGAQLAFPSDSTVLQKRRRLYNAARNRAKKE
ncbi:hypothetical protein BKI51_02575 [Alphaproteobacteria bacterium AO1-B]|nr:hypothetical protein BKI51_02575 [Alphaproteobacteria bacterium AO1-B]